MTWLLCVQACWKYAFETCIPPDCEARLQSMAGCQEEGALETAKEVPMASAEPVPVVARNRNSIEPMNSPCGTGKVYSRYQVCQLPMAGSKAFESLCCR
jgi:hypothetical protein